MTGFNLAAMAAQLIAAGDASGPVSRPEDYPAGRLPYRPYTLSPYDRGWIIESAWPTMFFGEEALQEIERKCGTLPWAKNALELMKREADIALKTAPLLPMEPVGWRHDFYSRATAEHLLHDPHRPEDYLDPSTGKYEHDEAQRKAWALLTHERTYRMMRSLGILYRLTGDERCAVWVVDGLRKAADYCAHSEFARDGALWFQPLYDAAELTLLANAYSLVRKHPALTADDHKRIRETIFEQWMPGQIEFLKAHPTHNMACYVSAALAYCGEVLDRPDWMGIGLCDETGMAAQLRNGLRAGPDGKVDGFWYEGTMFYHFYSICPLVTLWETDKRNNGKLTRDADLRARFTEMFAAPVALIDQALRLPPVGDLSAPRLMNLAAYRHLYEYAAGKLDPDRFGPLLASIYATTRAPRVELEALAYGLDELPEPDGVPKTHTVLRPTDTGVFRASTPHQMQLMFRCGRYVSGHDHPDRLQITLSAFGELISPDLGTPGYSLHGATHNYFRTTLAHNTLFADEAEQAGDAALEWEPDAGIPRARGTIIGKDGITYGRTVFFDPPYVVLLDEYDSDGERRFGWVYHAYGPVAVMSRLADAAISPALPDDRHFSLLTNRRTGMCADMLDAGWQVKEGLRLRLLTVSDGEFEATSGTTIGQPWPDTLGCIVLRAQGRKRCFATVLEPCQAEPTASSLSLAGDGAITVRLTDQTVRSYAWDAR